MFFSPGRAPPPDCDRRRQGSAPSAPKRLHEFSTLESSTRSPKNPGPVNPRGLATGISFLHFVSFTSSLTPDPQKASATLPGPRWWGPAQAAVRPALGYNWNASKNIRYPGFVYNFESHPCRCVPPPPAPRTPLSSPSPAPSPRPSTTRITNPSPKE